MFNRMLRSYGRGRDSIFGTLDFNTKIDRYNSLTVQLLGTIFSGTNETAFYVVVFWSVPIG